MSLLAAAVPVAVLVLAWDEAAPAVRALVEVTETTAPVLDSVVVLVPAAAGELTQEEFLPLAAEPTSSLAASSDENSVDSEADAEKATESTPLSPPAALPDSQLTESVLVVSPIITTPLKTSQTPLTTAAPASLAWSVVRVLRLSDFSLSELTELSGQALPRPIWQSSVVAPAAPYLGSQPELNESEAHLLAAPTKTQPETAAELQSQPVESAFPTPILLPTELPLSALDAEADLAPILPDELAGLDALPTEEAEATPAAQADWSDALASLHDPLPAEEPTPVTELEDAAAYYAATTGEQPATAADAEPAELPPPRQPFEAPNLNFQVIQYARFAVPVALAQLPFAAIYAPAWPTWLAAQELRYRTRQPLVLHVATLAAGEDKSVLTATGWQAELQRQALQQADLILAETPALAHRLRHDLGLPSELVRVVPADAADAVAQALRTAHRRSSASAS
jgi:hypothetical protein